MTGLPAGRETEAILRERRTPVRQNNIRAPTCVGLWTLYVAGVAPEHRAPRNSGSVGRSQEVRPEEGGRWAVAWAAGGSGGWGTGAGGRWAAAWAAGGNGGWFGCSSVGRGGTGAAGWDRSAPPPRRHPQRRVPGPEGSSASRERRAMRQEGGSASVGIRASTFPALPPTACPGPRASTWGLGGQPGHEGRRGHLQ